ncbi:MAG: dockerin type I repeat-containing protein, partial [Oscillospiraceae bacterium]|nr:dockerin type I repeat-containing protein [Oscillospiraceae bacterium]
MNGKLKTAATLLICFIMAFTAINFTVSASDLINGDVDMDKEITAADARLILRHVAKLETLTGDALKVADADFDGEITAADARLVLRHVAKLGELEPLKEDDTTTATKPETTTKPEATTKPAAKPT